MHSKIIMAFKTYNDLKKKKMRGIMLSCFELMVFEVEGLTIRAKHISILDIHLHAGIWWIKFFIQSFVNLIEQ